MFKIICGGRAAGKASMQEQIEEYHNLMRAGLDEVAVQEYETAAEYFSDAAYTVNQGNLYLIGLDSGTEHKIDKDSVKVLDKFEMTFKDASYVIDWIADNLVLTCDEARVIYGIQDRLKKEAKWQASNEENSLVKYATCYDSAYDRTIVFKHIYNNYNKNFEVHCIDIYSGKPDELCTKYVVLNSDRDFE